MSLYLTFTVCFQFVADTIWENAQATCSLETAHEMDKHQALLSLINGGLLYLLSRKEVRIYNLTILILPCMFDWLVGLHFWHLNVTLVKGLHINWTTNPIHMGYPIPKVPWGPVVVLVIPSVRWEC